jgi:hypothetical protein
MKSLFLLVGAALLSLSFLGTTTAAPSKKKPTAGKHKPGKKQPGTSNKKKGKQLSSLRPGKKHGKKPGKKPGLAGKKPGKKQGLKGKKPGLNGKKPGKKPGLAGKKPGKKPGLKGKKPGLNGKKPGLAGKKSGKKPGLAGKRPPRKHVSGRNFLPPSKMKRLGNGTHRVHSTHGHDVHATLSNGKLAGMQLKDKKGKVIQGRKVRQRRTAGLLGSDLHRVSHEGAADVLTLGDEGTSDDVVAVQGGFQIAFLFVIQFNGQSIQLVFVFSASDVQGGGEDVEDDDEEVEDQAASLEGQEWLILDNRFRGYKL